MSRGADISSQLGHLVVREYQPRDQSTVARLYTDGLLAGHIAPNDTGADIENIEEAYLSEVRNGFWVAEVEGQVLGMIGVAADREHTAEIRRLRVDKRYQDTPISCKLVERALEHCRHHGYLKVVLDTRLERDAAVDLFYKFGFQHTRTRSHYGKELPEFYLDLYRGGKPDNKNGR